VEGYPPAPQQRLAYDLDGSQVFRRRDSNGAFLINYNSVTVERLNNEHNGTAIHETPVGHGFLTQWLFPGPRDLFGVWATGDGDSSVENFFINISTSPDTRSWNSGAWSSAGVPGFTICTRVWDTWRTEIQTFSRENQWGFRGHSVGTGGLEFVGKILRQVHVYGDLHDPAYPNRVMAIDKDTGLELDLYDWGFIPRGSTKTKVIQVKNISQTHQAVSVSLSFSSLNTHSPDAWHTLSDGGSFTSSLNIGDLWPGETYTQDITIKLTPASNAGMGPWTNRLVIGVSEWKPAMDGEALGNTVIYSELGRSNDLDGESIGVGFNSAAISGAV
jgi:hypothetical protein